MSSTSELRRVRPKTPTASFTSPFLRLFQFEMDHIAYGIFEIAGPVVIDFVNKGGFLDLLALIPPRHALVYQGMYLHDRKTVLNLWF